MRKKKLVTQLKVKRNPDLPMRKVGKTIFIINPDDGEVYSLEEVSKFLWEQLRLPKSLSELSRLVCNTYDVVPSKAKKDTAEFLKSLLNRKILLRA